MRKMEAALRLPTGSLDQQPRDRLPAASATQVNTQQLVQMIQMVSRLSSEEGVTLTTDRFATLVAMTYEESAEHAGQVREGKIRQVVQLLK